MKLLIALLLAAAQAAAQPPGAKGPLAMFDRLAGSCWTTNFVPVNASIPSGDSLDTHCFSVLYDGQYVRDAHRVTRQGQVIYRGETTYSRDGEQVEFVYLNSLGGVSRGTAIASPEGIQFTSIYRAPGEEKPKEIASRWRWSGPDSYDVWDDDNWIRYSRGGEPEQL